MVKVSMLGHGCTRENVMELKFLDNLEKNQIKRANSMKESDFLVYVTCAGLGDTIDLCVKEIRDILAYMKYCDSELKLIVTGCLTTVPGILDSLDEYDNVKVIKDTDWPVKTINHILEKKNRLSKKVILENRTRRFYENNTSLQFFLEQGCTNRCAFCKSNYMPMPINSVPYDLALNHLKNEIRNGTKIINLSGDNLTLYGLDLYNEPIIHEFINELSNEKGLMYLNVFEIAAQNIYPKLVDELADNPKVNRVSMQIETASDRLLSLTNRNYDLEQFDEIVRRLTNRDKLVSTILMSGLPTETNEDIDITIDYIRKSGILTEDVCKYINYSKIPSDNLPQLSEREKQEHTKRLMRGVTAINNDILKKIIPKINQAILIGEVDDKYIFADKNYIIGVGKKDKYGELEIGTCLEISPKELVYKPKIGGGIKYNY
jgi:ribosomal protein S12 methylthiotransferase